MLLICMKGTVRSWHCICILKIIKNIALFSKAVNE